MIWEFKHISHVSCNSLLRQASTFDDRDPLWFNENRAALGEKESKLAKVIGATIKLWIHQEIKHSLELFDLFEQWFKTTVLQEKQPNWIALNKAPKYYSFIKEIFKQY